MEINEIGPELFEVYIYPRAIFSSPGEDEPIDVNIWWNDLTQEQRDRMAKKLELVTKAAAKMAANMLKGTLKYDKDDWSVEQWFEYMRDDTVDALNYMYLFEEAVKAKYAKEENTC